MKNAKSDNSQQEKDRRETSTSGSEQKEFLFKASIIKGLEIKSKGYEKEAVVYILKGLLSIGKPLFWLIIIICLMTFFLLVNNAETVLEFSKFFPEINKLG